MYHVGLALTPEQVRELKQLCLDIDSPVNGLVTKLVLVAIEEHKKEKEEEVRN